MVKKDARERISESVGTRVTRRTVTRGIAWTTPVVAVAAAAPAFATSQECTPIITIDASQSCRCTGRSTRGEEYTFFLRFCVSQNDLCPVVGDGSNTFEIIDVATVGSLKSMVFDPNNCFPAGGTPGDPENPGTTVGTLETCGEVLRFRSESSPSKIVVTYTVNGVEFTTDPPLDSPNFCSDVVDDPELSTRCAGCGAGDTVDPDLP